MRRNSQLFLAGWVAFVAACGPDGVDTTKADLEEHARSFVPEDASDVRVAPGIPWVQIDFDVRRDPLEFAVSEDRMVRAQQDGWTLCQPPTSDWSEFEDATVTPIVYRQEKLYALFKDGVLITVGGMYQSASRKDRVRRDATQAERPVQHGAVIARSITETDALAMADVLRLKCNSAGHG